MKHINLAGKWNVLEKGENKDFILPGSSCENEIGIKKDYYKEYSKEAVRTAIEKYEYVGELTLTREFEISAEDEGKNIKLFLERVNMASKLFIDGVQVGRQVISLSTPHIYNLTGKISAGKHLMKLVLDNSDLVNIRDMASGYSRDTQGFWNGVIGTIEIRIEEICHIEEMQIFPTEDGKIKVQASLTSEEKTPAKNIDAAVSFYVIKPDGTALPRKHSEIKLFASKHYWYLDYDISEAAGKIEKWDEFDQPLYKFVLELEREGQVVDKKELRFGMRTISKSGKYILINGRRAAFRGNVDCAQFPKTGYPPMTREIWEHNLGQIKEWGLNLVRFHGWCPPEAAFEVGDELGLYFQVEMPLWLNEDVTGIELGADPIHKSFLMQEAVRILKTYGNHPCFTFFSNGNENMGDYGMLEDITRVCKAYDSRHLYAITSNFDHPVGPVEDYFLAQDACGLPIRIQHIHDQVAKASNVNFDEAAQALEIPFMNFEVGQYGVYPDVDIIKDYDGNMLPVNFDVIKKEMIKAGVYDRREEYIKASGDLCYRLYKEDVEAVYRTKDMSGYQLLCIQDYSGQDTATVGIMDVMYRDKGIVKKDVWKEFVGPVVPLFEAKRIYSNSERIEAKLGLYNYGKEEIKNPEYKIKINKINGAGKTEILNAKQTSEHFEFALSDIKTASRLNVEVEVKGHKNHWDLFVYPSEIANETAEIQETIKIEKPVSSGYIPVFWSPVMFETDKPSGAIIKKEHEIFIDFPTEKYPDYQWKDILDNAIAVDVATLEYRAEPIVELVPNYDCNKIAMVLFEGIYDGKKALYCGLDLEKEDLPTKQLKQSIVNYVNKNKMALVECRA